MHTALFFSPSLCVFFFLLWISALFCSRSPLFPMLFFLCFLGFSPWFLLTFSLLFFFFVCVCSPMFLFSYTSLVYFFFPSVFFFLCRSWLFFFCSAFYRARELQNQSCLCRTVIQITNGIVGRRRGPWFAADFMLNRLSPCETKGMMNSASKRRRLCPWEWLYFTLAPKRFKLNNWDLNH